MIQLSFCRMAFLGTVAVLFAPVAAVAEIAPWPSETQITQIVKSEALPVGQPPVAFVALFAEENDPVLLGSKPILGPETEQGSMSPVGHGYGTLDSFMPAASLILIALDGRGVGLAPYVIDSADQDYIITTQAHPLWDGRGVGLIDLAMYPAVPAEAIGVGF